MAAKLLVVEDEDAVALTLEAVLASEGYDVATAGDAAQAIERLSSQPFDLALLDLHLGDGDGLQVLSRMQELTPGTPAIVLTGYGSLETAIKAMRSGAADYLLKPCDVADLKAAIVRALRRRAPAEPAVAPLSEASEPYLEVACQEIKTPLTAVIGWAQYAKRRLNAGAARDAGDKLDAVLQEAWRIAHLVDAFHGIACADDVRTDLDFEPVDLRRALQAAVGTMHAEYGRRRYLLSLPETPALVAVPPAALTTLFTTLIEAAMRSSLEPVTVGIGLELNGREAIVSLRLDGARQSAAAVVEALAVPRTVDGINRLAQPGGLGIGLHLVRRLSEAYGGRLWAERTADGIGIAIRLALPLASRGAEAAGPPARSAAEPGA